MSRKSTILAVLAAFAVALVGACSGEPDQDPAEVEPGPEAEVEPGPDAEVERSPDAEVERGPEAGQAPVGPPPPGQPDAYGREPGDPHYGHDHPPAGQAPATAPPSGEPDAYGREPGDPHYGHDHP